MKVSLLLVVLAIASWSLPVLACRTPTGAPSRPNREARLEQRALIAIYAAKSDQILVVRALNGPSDFPGGNNQLGGQFPAKFRVIRALKGATQQTVTATVRWGIVVSCGGTDFKQLLVESGGEYVLYLQQGEVIRAGPKHRSPGNVTFRQELRLLRQLQRPNNSFKPKPLRGSA